MFIWWKHHSCGSIIATMGLMYTEKTVASEAPTVSSCPPMMSDVRFRVASLPMFHRWDFDEHEFKHQLLAHVGGLQCGQQQRGGRLGVQWWPKWNPNQWDLIIHLLRLFLVEDHAAHLGLYRCTHQWTGHRHALAWCWNQSCSLFCHPPGYEHSFWVQCDHWGPQLAILDQWPLLVQSTLLPSLRALHLP